MAKRWKKQDATYLKRYATKRTVAELAERFRTDAATVRKKLDELELSAADYAPPETEPDPAVEPLAAGLDLLYAKKWKAAEKKFATAAGQADQPELANRARRYLAVARQRQRKRAEMDDPYLQAVYERNRGNLEQALELCARGGRQSKDERFALLAAAIHATTGDHEKAAKFLETAIRLNPKNRVHAYHDPDFEALRSQDDYAHLFTVA